MWQLLLVKFHYWCPEGREGFLEKFLDFYYHEKDFEPLVSFLFLNNKNSKKEVAGRLMHEFIKVLIARNVLHSIPDPIVKALISELESFQENPYKAHSLWLLVNYSERPNCPKYIRDVLWCSFRKGLKEDQEVFFNTGSEGSRDIARRQLRDRTKA
jgi:hypothetical protein